MIAVGETETDLILERSRPRRARSRTRPVRVLLAEDDLDLRLYVTRSLEWFGYEVAAVDSGFHLVVELSDWILGKREHAPADVLVTDVRMPGFDGMSIVRSMCASEWKLPTIVMSAVRPEELRLETIAKPNVLFLPKPLDVTRLASCVQHLARR